MAGGCPSASFRQVAAAAAARGASCRCQRRRVAPPPRRLYLCAFASAQATAFVRRPRRNADGLSAASTWQQSEQQFQFQLRDINFKHRASSCAIEIQRFEIITRARATEAAAAAYCGVTRLAAASRNSDSSASGQVRQRQRRAVARPTLAAQRHWRLISRRTCDEIRRLYGPNSTSAGQ